MGNTVKGCFCSMPADEQKSDESPNIGRRPSFENDEEELAHMRGISDRLNIIPFELPLPDLPSEHSDNSDDDSSHDNIGYGGVTVGKSRMSMSSHPPLKPLAHLPLPQNYSSATSTTACAHPNEYYYERRKTFSGYDSSPASRHHTRTRTYSTQTTTHTHTHSSLHRRCPSATYTAASVVATTPIIVESVNDDISPMVVSSMVAPGAYADSYAHNEAETTELVARAEAETESEMKAETLPLSKEEIDATNDKILDIFITEPSLSNRGHNDIQCDCCHSDGLPFKPNEEEFEFSSSQLIKPEPIVEESVSELLRSQPVYIDRIVESKQAYSHKPQNVSDPPLDVPIISAPIIAVPRRSQELSADPHSLTTDSAMNKLAIDVANRSFEGSMSAPHSQHYPAHRSISQISSIAEQEGNAPSHHSDRDMDRDANNNYNKPHITDKDIDRAIDTGDDIHRDRGDIKHDRGDINHDKFHSTDRDMDTDHDLFKFHNTDRYMDTDRDKGDIDDDLDDCHANLVSLEPGAAIERVERVDISRRYRHNSYSSSRSRCGSHCGCGGSGAIDRQCIDGMTPLANDASSAAVSTLLPASMPVYKCGNVSMEDTQQSDMIGAILGYRERKLTKSDDSKSFNHSFGL